MKKAFILPVLIFVLAGEIFALDIPKMRLSRGGGLFYAGNYKRMEATAGTYLIEAKSSLSAFGFFGFFDATFFEVDFNFFFGPGEVELRAPGFLAEEVDSSFTGLGFGLLGKFPFVFNKFSVFPLLGFEYQVFFGGDYEYLLENNDPWDFNAFWFKFGLGADYAVTDAFYVRGEFLYGFRTKNQFEKDTESFVRNQSPLVHVKHGPGHGPSLKFAMGYKFP
jgi:hypothetical protein